MNLTEILMNQLSDSGLKQISQQVGADEATTNQAVKAAVPLLVAALARNSSQPDGAASLNKALERHDGGILEDIAGYLGGGGHATDGAAILGHVLGNRQNTIQKTLANQVGMNTESIGKLLVLLAPMIMGALGKTKRQNSFDSGSLAGYLNVQKQQAQAESPGIMDMVTGLLDTNKDGSVLDELGQFAGQLFGKKKQRQP